MTRFTSPNCRVGNRLWGNVYLNTFAVTFRKARINYWQWSCLVRNTDRWIALHGIVTYEAIFNAIFRQAGVPYIGIHQALLSGLLSLSPAYRQISRSVDLFVVGISKTTAIKYCQSHEASQIGDDWNQARCATMLYFLLSLVSSDWPLYATAGGGPGGALTLTYLYHCDRSSRSSSQTDQPMPLQAEVQV